MELYIKALEGNLDERLYQQWLVEITRMTEENNMGFEEYKRKSIQPPAEKIDANKVIEDMEKIKNLDQRGGR